MTVTPSMFHGKPMKKYMIVPNRHPASEVLNKMHLSNYSRSFSLKVEHRKGVGSYTSKV